MSISSLNQISVTYQSVHLLLVVLIAELVLLERSHYLRIVRLEPLLNCLAVALNACNFVVDSLENVHLGT